ncbi:helix-turn-helix transcriptional regulator [Mesorhizobium sp. CCNWLW179-1]|uniref:helix-turn-helix transcriptional regulator n=1 Tax=unclassified Mesorhizobium TaxID=325217 RepID=UPI0030157012
MGDKDSRLRSGFVERRHHSRVAKTPLGVNEPPLKGALVPLRFRTAKLPPSGQFPAWQEHMTALLDCRLPEDAAVQDGFLAEQTIWNLGGALIIQQAIPAFSFERPPGKLRLSPIDHWWITFLHSGRSWTEVDGHVAQNEPGMMEIRSLGRPFRGRKLASVATSLIVPVDLFAGRGGLPAASNNVVLGGYRIRLLMDYLSSVEANLDRFTQDDLAGVKDRLREMVFDAVMPLLDRGDDRDEISQVGLMTRARRFIMNNISSSDLTIESLCRELAISRTRLYELFEASGGVANYIRRRRLLAAHAMLSDPADSRRVADVGFAIGFDSPANFSRAFTQQFGYSPSNIRMQNSTDRNSPLRGETQESPPNLTFESLLRTLALF